jgi:hypothetical protein
MSSKKKNIACAIRGRDFELEFPHLLYIAYQSAAGSDFLAGKFVEVF